MYIGELKIKSTNFTHKDVEIPFAPTLIEDDVYTWAWNNVYDSELDLNYELESKAFIGAVSLTLSQNAVSKVEIFVDGTLAGTHTAKTGGLTGGEITVPVGMNGERITARLHPELTEIKLISSEILGAVDNGGAFVYPTPKSLEFLGGYAKIRDIVSKNGDPDEIYAAEFLKERLTETFGEWQAKRGSVIVFDKKQFKTYDGERYTVKTTKGKITVSAKTRLTLLYGADTVLQLTEAKSGVKKFNCDDKPEKPFRGFHAGLPERAHFEFMRRLFRYVLLPLRYNTLFVQVSACMKLKKHPEINEVWAKTCADFRRGLVPTPPHIYMLAEGEILEQEEVVEYVNFARELGFEIIPEVQSLGHVQYITLAHPDVAEIDENDVVVEDTRDEDARPAAKYHHCYCPSLEKSYELIFDIMDEVIDVIKPTRFVHIGHDEIYKIGVCKRCRDKDPAVLLATHVNRLHDHLKEKGLGTMMWADMLQPPPVTAYPTYKAIDLVNKEVIMLDFIWYFNTGLDIEDNLIEKNFTVAAGNLYSSHYTRYRKRMTKRGMIGGEISTWLNNSEKVYGENGKLWDAIFLSEMLWNTSEYDERNRAAYTERILKYLQPKMRDEIRGAFNPKGYKATSIKLPKGESAPADVKAICKTAINGAGVPVTVGAKFDRLVIEHATYNSAPRIVWVPIADIGAYTVTYSDGTTVEIPVQYTNNIMAYKTTYAAPMPQPFYRHNGYVGTWFIDPACRGKNAFGEDIMVSGFLWENPNPDKEIKSIVYTPVDGDYCGLILAGIKGLNKK